MSEQEFTTKARWWTAFWQRWARNLDGVRGCDNPLLALGLRYTAVAERRLWRRYLRQFGLRVPRSGRLHTIRARRGVALTRRELCAIPWGFENLFISDAIVQAIRRNDLAGAWEAFARLPVLLGHGMFLLPLTEQKNAAAESATGWARAGLRIFGRMQNGLPKDEAGRLAELGAAVAQAFGEAAHGESPRDLRRHVARLWVEPVATREEPLAEAAGIEDDAALRGMAEVEVRDLLESANLSPREAEAMQAWLRGDTESQAAARMKVRVGTIRQLLARGKRKVRAVA